MKPQVILLGPEHISQIIPLVKQLNPAKSDGLLRARLCDMFNYAHYVCFGLIEEPEQLLAVSSAWTTTRLYSGKQLEVDNVVVDSAQRERGLGELLMNFIEKWAQEHDYLSVELNAYIENDGAQRFYERRGFRKLGYHMVKGSWCGT